MRLDRFIAARLGVVSRARVKHLIEAGAVRVADRPITAPATTVRHGLLYQVTMPEPEPATPIGQSIPLTLLYEDSDLLVLDKPAGLVVHPAPGNQDGTLVNALIAHCGASLTGIGAERRPGIVHRLDKDTSGLMVVAKTEIAHVALSHAFAARDINRAYTALCWGVPEPREGEIDGAIGRDPRDRKRMAVVTRGGKLALTRYRVEESFSAGAALLTCRLATGRTHQIRVHLAARGHPLIGDPVYLRRIPAMATRFDPERKRAMLDFPRQALHAHRLGFRHPCSGIDLFFETPLPADMTNLLDLLRCHDL